MISYKKIDLLKLSIDSDKNIVHDGEIIEIKSPIIEFEAEYIDNSFIGMNLKINKNSDLHNLFANLLGYIERIYNLNNIRVIIIHDDVIKIKITESSRFFDSKTKEINMNFFNSGNFYKGLFSFYINSGDIYLKQMILLK